MSAKFHYDMDKAGVSEILKSAPVRAALADLAEEKTAEANGMLRAHGGDAGHGYAHHAHVLTHASIESVHTAGVTTELDQKKHHTLNAINH